MMGGGDVGTLLQDWSANRGSPESQLVLLLFRSAQLAHRRVRPAAVARALVVLYRVLTRLYYGIELPVQVQAGPGLVLLHGDALVVHPKTVLGARCVLRQSVTIGEQRGPDGSVGVPVFGDDVEVGPGAMIIGKVVIGSRARIGPGALVLRSVPVGGVVSAAPARLITTEGTVG